MCAYQCFYMLICGGECSLVMSGEYELPAGK